MCIEIYARVLVRVRVMYVNMFMCVYGFKYPYA